MLLTLAAFVGLAIASHFWGADSRPGFGLVRADRVERWFPHSRAD
jgi:hypothetical protein